MREWLAPYSWEFVTAQNAVLCNHKNAHHGPTSDGHDDARRLWTECHLDKRIEAYRGEPMPDWAAHDIVVRAVDCKAITTSQIPHVLQEWRKPRHPDFKSRNARSLFNAFTEVHKRINPHAALRRSEALHGLFDATVGLT